MAAASPSTRPSHARTVAVAEVALVAVAAATVVAGVAAATVVAVVGATNREHAWCLRRPCSRFRGQGPQASAKLFQASDPMPTSKQEKPSAEQEKHQRQEHSAAIGQLLSRPSRSIRTSSASVIPKRWVNVLVGRRCRVRPGGSSFALADTDGNLLDSPPKRPRHDRPGRGTLLEHKAGADCAGVLAAAD